MGTEAEPFGCFRSTAIRKALLAFDNACNELEKENRELKRELSKVEALRSAIKEIKE